jgi:hypothetical protein
MILGLFCIFQAGIEKVAGLLLLPFVCMRLRILGLPKTGSYRNL